MSLHEECSALLHALGLRFGIADLAFDERGSCSLAFDRRLTVNLAVDPGLNGLVLLAVLGEITPLASPELLLALLRGNFLWRATRGATLAIDVERNAVLLMQCVEPGGQRYSGDSVWIESLINEFVNAAFSWIERMERLPDELMPSEIGGDPRDAFLRV